MKNHRPYEIMKLATFNIKRTAESARLKAFISSLDVDVVVFQEATQSTIRHLDMNYVMHRGLAVVSRHSIQKLDVMDLGRMWKAALKVRVMKRTIVVVHLEHESEEVRFEQMTRLGAFLEGVDIVAGDFNDTHLKEYTVEEVSQFESDRRRAGLAPMTGRVMQRLEAYGFTIGERVGTTTPYHTRVDYIAFKNHTVRSTRVIDCISDGLSDHNMVYMSLEMKL